MLLRGNASSFRLYKSPLNYWNHRQNRKGLKIRMIIIILNADIYIMMSF